MKPLNKTFGHITTEFVLCALGCFAIEMFKVRKLYVESRMEQKARLGKKCAT